MYYFLYYLSKLLYILPFPPHLPLVAPSTYPLQSDSPPCGSPVVIEGFLFIFWDVALGSSLDFSDASPLVLGENLASAFLTRHIPPSRFFITVIYFHSVFCVRSRRDKEGRNFSDHFYFLSPIFSHGASSDLPRPFLSRPHIRQLLYPASSPEEENFLFRIFSRKIKYVLDFVLT